VLCPACESEPCACDFTPEELAEMGRAVTVDDMLEVLRKQFVRLSGDRKPDEPLH